MKRYLKRVGILLGFFWILPMGEVLAQVPPPMGQSSSSNTEDKLSLSFTDADIVGVIKAVAEAIGQTILVDPKVKGTMTLVSDKPLTHEQVLSSLAASLRLQGYALVKGSGFYRVVLEADAKLQGGPVAEGSSGSQGDQVVTEVFHLRYESATNLVTILRPLIAPNNTITADPSNNSLVITDYAENIHRLAKIINAVDAPAIGDVTVIPLRYGIATDFVGILNHLVDNAGSSSDANLKPLIVADSRTNSLILRAMTPTRLAELENLISKLDVPTSQPGNIWVVPLKNAEAIKLAKTLRGIIAKDTGNLNSASDNAPLSAGLVNGGGLATGASSGSNGSAGASGTSPSGSPSGSGSAGGVGAAGSVLPYAPTSGGGGGGSSGGSASSESASAGMIQADATTNSIIIMANEQVYRNLRSVIERLDARRAQIYVESMIVEVSSNKTAEFGVQLQGILGSGSTQAFLGTNFNTINPGGNIVSLGTSAGSLSTLGGNLNNNTNLNTNTVFPAAGTNLGILHSFNGVLGLASLARAVSLISGVNVLSTPNLLTLDNEKAQIVIAVNVPFVTGSYAQTGFVAGGVSPFTTVDRKDVGLTLTIKPQISEGGLVRMQIYEESSALDPTTLNNVNGPSYTKRAVESTVLVQDGQLIALGGLLQDSYNDSMEKTPFLGDLPYIGAFFRYETKTHIKTNLMLFLRPYVIRDAEQSDAITQDRYSLTREYHNNYEPNVRILSNETLLQLPPDNGPGSPMVSPLNAPIPTTVPPPRGVPQKP